MISITLTNEQKDRLIRAIQDEIPFVTGEELTALCEIIAAVPPYVFPTPAPVRLTSVQWDKIHCINVANNDGSDPELLELDKLIVNASETFADAEGSMINVTLSAAQCTHALNLIEDNLQYAHGQPRRRLQALRAKLVFRTGNAIALTQWEILEIMEFLEDEPAEPPALKLYCALEVAAGELEVTA